MILLALLVWIPLAGAAAGGDTTTWAYCLEHPGVPPTHSGLSDPAGLDSIVVCNDGTGFRYACLQRANPDTPFYSRCELCLRTSTRNPTGAPSSVIPVLWWNLDDLPRNVTVESARILLRPRYTPSYCQDEGLFAVLGCRRSDRHWLDAPPWPAAEANGNTCFRSVTWEMIDSASGYSWADSSVSMTTRDGWTDFGFDSGWRSGPFCETPADSVSDLFLDVTEYVQMIVDLPGFQYTGFWIFGDRSDAFQSIWMSDVPGYFGYDPVLVVKFRDEPHAQPWNGYPLAFAFQSPDAHVDALQWADAFSAKGYRFTCMAPEDLLAGRPWRLDGSDLAAVHAMGHEVSSHSRTHLGLQWTCDPDSLDWDVGKQWMRDVSGIADLPVNSFNYPDNDFHYLGIEALIRAGYLGSCYSGGGGPEPGHCSDAGDNAELLSWNGIRTPYISRAEAIQFLAGAAADTDLTYTDLDSLVYAAVIEPGLQNKALMITGAHTTKWTINNVGIWAGGVGVDPDEIMTILQLLEDSGLVWITTMGDGFALYHEGHHPVDPPAGSVAAAEGYTALDRIFFAPGPESEPSGIAPRVPPPGPGLRVSPNPFNPATGIEIDLAEDSRTLVDVFDLRGRLVKSLYSGELGRGTHILTWRGTDGSGRRVPSGAYLIRVLARGVSKTRKVALIE